MNDADLQRLGRQHTAAEALSAFELAKSVFARVSCDLIYARQHQSLNDWNQELYQLLSLSPDHASLYQLTIEDGTAFGDLHKRKKLRGLPTEDLAADMYDLTTQLCAEAGLHAYEVSNYAKPGLESRHNLVYWRMGDYAGIGPGAHGRLTLNGQRIATETLRNPESWLSAAQTGSGETPRVHLSPRDQALEYLMMSLRLSEGCNTTRISALSPGLLSEKGVESLVSAGLVTKSDAVLQATPSGRLVLNQLFLELTAD